jgi:hypothetical protein
MREPVLRVPGRASDEGMRMRMHRERARERAPLGDALCVRQLLVGGQVEKGCALLFCEEGFPN